MANARHNLGLVFAVSPSAIGEPGKRQFRITAEGPGGSVVLWVEKQQLQDLALAIHRILATHSHEGDAQPAEKDAASTPSQTLDFRAGVIALEYEEASRTFQMEADDRTARKGAPPLVRLLISREQGRGLAERALEVCAAGRPQCPLCFAPVDPGEHHVCPMANGHVKHLA